MLDRPIKSGDDSEEYGYTSTTTPALDFTAQSVMVPRP
jgi:hypothetical protein